MTEYDNMIQWDEITDQMNIIVAWSTIKKGFQPTTGAQFNAFLWI